MKLFREDKRQAGIFDVCDWWINNYPSDIFEGLSPETKEIADVRLAMRKILLRRVKVKPSNK